MLRKALFLVASSALVVCGARATANTSPDRPAPGVLVSVSQGLPNHAAYTVASESWQAPLAEQKTFNGAQPGQLRSVTLSGTEIVFDPSDDTLPLNRYHSRRDIASLTLLAERVVIRAPLHLPASELLIRARELVFEDSGSDKASISTTPLPFNLAARPGELAKEIGILKRPGTGKNGRPGQDGGDIRLEIETLIAQDNSPRLLLDGGKGQDPGPGKHGVDGKYTQKPFSYKKERNLIYREHFNYFVITKKKTWGNLRKKPTRGGHATAGGQPGDGGRGGRLVSSVTTAADLASQNGGPAGKPSPAYKGGKGKSWRAIKTETWPDHRILVPKISVIDKGHSGNGRNAPAREGRPGTKGDFIAIPMLPDGWASAATESAALARARDLHLAGYLQEASDMTTAHLNRLARILQREPLRAEEFAQVQHGWLMLGHALVNGLDFFGNPPGWTPMLSLEANYRTYRAETRQALRSLALAHWLGQHWQNQDARERGLKETLALIRLDAEAAERRFNNSRLLLPTLETEKGNLQGEMEMLRTALDKAEKEIAEQFRNDKEEQRRQKAAISAASTVLSTLAFVGITAASGGTLSPLAAGLLIGGAGVAAGAQDYMYNQPRAVSDNRVSGYFDRLEQDERIVEAQNRLAELDPGAASRPSEFTRALDQASEAYSEIARREIESEIQQHMALSVPEAELDAARRENQEFSRLLDQLIDVVTRRQLYVQKLAETAHSMEQAVGEIAELEHAAERMQTALDDNVIDHRHRMDIFNMQLAARDRLLRYQYYLIKSYEYRMLEPGPARYFSNQLYDKLAANFGLDAATDKAATELPPYDVESPLFRELDLAYTEVLREIAEHTVRGLNEERPAPTRVTKLLSLSPQELDALNSEGSIALDLASRVLVGTDINARLVSVEVDPGLSAFHLADADSGQPVNAEISVEPGSQAELRWNNAAYLFQFGNGSAANAVRWGFTWDSLSQRFQPYGSSNEKRDLLKVLLDDRDSHSATRIEFLPAARTQLVIRQETSPRETASLSQLALRVTLQKNKAF